MFWALGKAFFTSLQIFELKSWKHFLGKQGKAFELIKSIAFHIKFFRKWFWNYLEIKSEYTELLKMKLFGFYCKFLTYEIETIFRENKASPLSLLKSNIGRIKNSFEDILRSKTNLFYLFLFIYWLIFDVFIVDKFLF